MENVLTIDKYTILSNNRIVVDEKKVQKVSIG